MWIPAAFSVGACEAASMTSLWIIWTGKRFGAPAGLHQSQSSALISLIVAAARMEMVKALSLQKGNMKQLSKDMTGAEVQLY